MYRKLSKESKQDFLTGLNNVRQFDELFNFQLKLVDERKERLSLLAIDIDHFKTINDTYGHSNGDVVLWELGSIFKKITRTFDIVSRNGGEEFSIILPDYPYFHDLEIAERIRKAVEEHRFLLSGEREITITVSIGVSSYPETVSSPTQVLEDADRALYIAKRMGRNQVQSTVDKGYMK